MNICPQCESTMDEGLALCPQCDEGYAEETGESPPEAGPNRDGAVLEVQDGEMIPLAGEKTVLGRRDPLEDIEPDLDLSPFGGFEQGVSRRHALIKRDEDRYVLEDLGSKNGTLVNRHRVAPGDVVGLSEGDVIHFGRLKVVFHAAGGDGGS